MVVVVVVAMQSSIHDTTDNAFFGGMLIMQAFAVIAAVSGLAVGAWFVWTNAPVVGGEFWPYIRVVGSIIGAIIGAKVFALIAYLAFSLIMGVIALAT